MSFKKKISLKFHEHCLFQGYCPFVSVCCWQDSFLNIYELFRAALVLKMVSAHQVTLMPSYTLQPRHQIALLHDCSKEVLINYDFGRKAINWGSIMFGTNCNSFKKLNPVCISFSLQVTSSVFNKKKPTNSRLSNRLHNRKIWIPLNPDKQAAFN